MDQDPSPGTPIATKAQTSSPKACVQTPKSPAVIEEHRRRVSVEISKATLKVVNALGYKSCY
jgi:hypothetical protein